MAFLLPEASRRLRITNRSAQTTYGDSPNAAYMNTSFMNSWLRRYRVRARVLVEIVSDSSE